MNPAKITRLARVALSALAFLCVLTGLARAGTATSISGLYTTGMDGTDKGRLDDHWRLGNGAFAYVVTNTTATSNGWYTAANGTAWISAAQNGGVSSSGDYTYTLTFNIAGTGTGAVTGVNIYMTLAVDDSAVISVNGGNGVSTTGTGQWARTQNVTLSNGFVIGANTITVTVSNSGAGPSGILISSISGVVPEVGAWVPLAVAFGLIAWTRFRPRKRSFPAAV